MRIFCPAMVASVSFSRCRYVRKRWLSYARRTLDPALSDPRGRACRACCRYAAFIKQLDHGDLECRVGLENTPGHPARVVGTQSLRRNPVATNHPARTQPD